MNVGRGVLMDGLSCVAFYGMDKAGGESEWRYVKWINIKS